MRVLLSAILLGISVCAVPSIASAEYQPRVATEEEQLNVAMVMRAQGKLDTALEIAEQLIRAHDKIASKEKRHIYSARSPDELFAYLTTSAGASEESVVMDSTWGYALYLKGFILIDLRRGEEARDFLERAVTLSPSNAQFIGELAEWHKARGRWEEALALFQRADEATILSPEDVRAREKGRTLRGIGFVQIELGKLQEAETTFKKCLEIDPGDQRAKNELEYINQTRNKARS